ncbi:hypothetical protein B0H15DRAFT_114745 [Mycena belliarum]|uniref:Transmembrane protein n=1 Tax=Mycena belliarum TaxID=1033014 RepID=A0AAD6TMC1_9AGAR|nr:hypothetical protein B0H15DRAFT_114745 [Mycena belliae]
MQPISTPIAKQAAMNLYAQDEKAPVYEAYAHGHAHGHAHAHDLDGDESAQWSARTGAASHKPCHNGRLRRMLVPALLAFLALSVLGALFCVFGEGMADPNELVEGLFQVKRAVDGSGSSESDFTKRKLYLIVIFVGLLVVVILAVMLSAWCCKGAFQNPLCCPCYLCACCGGLACLECIGCGLCAEGVDQM